MGIGSITSMNSMSGMQTTMAGSTSSKNKGLQNEITVARQQMQALSSKDDLSVNEKTNERRKLQKEISSLNTELKQHQDQLRKSQRREIMMAEMQEDNDPTQEGKSKGKIQADDPNKKVIAEKDAKISDDINAAAGLSDEEKHTIASADTSLKHTANPGTVIAKTNDGTVILKEKFSQNENSNIAAENKPAEEASLDKADEKNLPVIDEKDAKTSESNTNTGLSSKEIHAIVSADTSIKQASRQETIIAKISDGIVILKGEINQDEKRGINTEKKQAELEKMEKKEQLARTFQHSVLGETNNAMKSAINARASGTKNSAQVNADNSAFVNTFKFQGDDEQALQQRFYVSLNN